MTTAHKQAPAKKAPATKKHDELDMDDPAIRAYLEQVEWDRQVRNVDQEPIPQRPPTAVVPEESPDTD